jgi:8-oxo-dGTP diphosphatase
MEIEESTRFIVAVAGIVFRGPRVLAMRRASHRDAGAGLWETFSGRVQAKEQPLAALLRETREECGLTVEYDPRPLGAVQTVRRNEPMIVLYYSGVSAGGDVVCSTEHYLYAWLTVDEFAERCTLGPLVEMVRKAAHGASE